MSGGIGGYGRGVDGEVVGGTGGVGDVGAGAVRDGGAVGGYGHRGGGGEAVGGAGDEAVGGYGRSGVVGGGGSGGGTVVGGSVGIDGGGVAIGDSGGAGDVGDVGDERTAAVRYKAIVGLARKAAADLRAWEESRAEELNGEIAAAAEQVTAATEAERAMNDRARRWWNMAADNVARLSWLDVGPEPEPIASARGEWLNRYAEDVRPAYHELTQAVLKLSWRAR